VLIKFFIDVAVFALLAEWEFQGLAVKRFFILFFLR
jgi:hypothetical protein